MPPAPGRPGALSRRVRTLRFRLLALVLVPLVLLAMTVILLGARWSTDITYRQLRAMVTTDLSVARDAFQRLQSDALIRLADAAGDPALLAALDEGDTDALDELIGRTARQRGFDSLTVYDAEANERFRQGAWIAMPAPDVALWQQVRKRSMSISEPIVTGAVGVERVPRSLWSAELSDAAVEIALVDTPRAAPDERAVAGALEDRALLVRVLHPVLDDRGRTRAWLDAGVLLNRSLLFVDAMRDLVYGPGRLADGSRGTVTLFLDDVRVSTNVPDREARRALGTRVSAEVREHVLGRGLRWIDRAFVVNAWYMSAYEPILDPAGRRIGMLYVGFLEQPFRADLLRAIAALAILSLAGCLLAALAATLGARAIFQPVERMAEVVRATAIGEHRRIGTLEAADELRELARQFDAMLDALEAQRLRIEDDSRSLERKVTERTEALQERNVRLQESLDLLRRTREQLATAERLAALGELTAGVAHEINNPTAVILGNLDILVEEIGDAREGVSVEIDLIMDQVFRIRSITDRLLAWSRAASIPQPPAPAGRISATLASLVADALALVQHELLARDVSIIEEHADHAHVAIDPQECLQVLVNLVQNALEAGDNERSRAQTLSLRSRPAGDLVLLDIEDNGPGILPEHLPRLFDPFFTAGKRGGSGLGLSVSHGIVHRAGGRIEVSSRYGKGARFTLVLPRARGERTDIPTSAALSRT